MSDTLQSSIAAALNWTLSDTTDLISTPRDSQTVTPTYTWVDGVAADQADMIWRDSRTIVGAGVVTDDLDLVGVLIDVFGNTVNFHTVRALLIWNTSTVLTSILTIGNAATPWLGPLGAAAHTIEVRPGGMLLVVTPDAVGWHAVGGASDKLGISKAAGGDATYKIAIIGASA